MIFLISEECCEETFAHTGPRRSINKAKEMFEKKTVLQQGKSLKKNVTIYIWFIFGNKGSKLSMAH